jgi:hypothetical protein
MDIKHNSEHIEKYLWINTTGFDDIFYYNNRVMNMKTKNSIKIKSYQ